MSVECDQARKVRGEGIVRCQLEPEESVSTAVVEAVERASGRSAIPDAEASDPLSPLYEAVDPDALERLFDRRGEAGEASAVLGFEFETWYVFVGADGRIRVCDRSQPTEPEPVFENHTA